MSVKLFLNLLSQCHSITDIMPTCEHTITTPYICAHLYTIDLAENTYFTTATVMLFVGRIVHQNHLSATVTPTEVMRPPLKSMLIVFCNREPAVCD